MSVLDTHCGGGHFWLSDSDDWDRGIGRFTDSLSLLRSFGEIVGPYLSVGQYLGSWLLVASLLKKRAAPFQLHACDLSDEVALHFDVIARRFGHVGHCWHSQCDGYECAIAGPPSSFVFLDPPYTPDSQKDWTELRRTICAIKPSCVTVATWYPIYWPTQPNELIAATDMISHELIWADFGAKPSQNPKGCGFAVTSRVALDFDPAAEAARLVAERLGGRYSRRARNK